MSAPTIPQQPSEAFAAVEQDRADGLASRIGQISSDPANPSRSSLLHYQLAYRDASTNAAAYTVQPGGCPPWCEDGTLACEGHWGQLVALPNPDPQCPVENPVLLEAQLVRVDEDGRPGRTVVYLVGETDAELSGAKLAAFIARGRAFFDALEAMSGETGGDS